MPLPRRPDAVVFDMDGLLFDTEALYRDAIFAAAVEFGCDMPPSLFSSMLGTPWPVNRMMLLDHYGSGFQIDSFRRTWLDHFDRMLATGLRLKPGAVELLELLDELILPRAIATSSMHSSVDHHLAAHGLIGRFGAVIAHGDYLQSKPAPDPFLRAAERLGVDPHRCLALEDSHNGIRSASSAGMMTVMVPDLLEPTDEIRLLCAAIARDLHEVRDMILAAEP